MYALLVLSCVGLYFLDLSRFAFLPYATKACVVGLLTSLPMLFSGIVFIRSFAAPDRKDAALGANLIGALVGGLLAVGHVRDRDQGAAADRRGALPGRGAEPTEGGRRRQQRRDQ